MAAEIKPEPKFDYDAFDLPENVSLTFHLGHHFSAQDLPDAISLGETFRNADIVIPEFVHDSESKSVMAAIAMGRTKEFQRFQSDLRGNDMAGWLSAFASNLFASRTSTANVDIHESHPAVELFNSTEPDVRRTAALPVRENFETIVSILSANLASVKMRDQAILENIKPEIEATISMNQKLARKREREPLDVHLYYGATHTSLFDGLAFKQQEAAVEGFSVHKSDDSIENELSQMSYANFVRDIDIKLEDVERHFAYLIFFSHLKRSGRFKGQLPTQQLQDIFLSLEQVFDYGNPRTIPSQMDSIDIPL